MCSYQILSCTRPLVVCYYYELKLGAVWAIDHLFWLLFYSVHVLSRGRGVVFVSFWLLCYMSQTFSENCEGFLAVCVREDVNKMKY